MAGEVEGDRMAVKIAHARTPPNNQCAWSNFSSNFFLLLWHVLHILWLRIDISFLSANMEDQHVDIKRSHWLMRRLARGHHLQIKCGKFVRSQHKLVWYAGYLKMNSLTVGYGLWVMHNRLNFLHCFDGFANSKILCMLWCSQLRRRGLCRGLGVSQTNGFDVITGSTLVSQPLVPYPS